MLLQNLDAASNKSCNSNLPMDAPPINGSPRMFCRKCGYILDGLPSNRCPECGTDFNPADPKSFLDHPPRVLLRRLIKIVVVLFCLSLPLDGYAAHLGWELHEETKAIGFLRSKGAVITMYNTMPSWAKAILGKHGAWLWERAEGFNLQEYVNGPHISEDQADDVILAVGKLKSLQCFLSYGMSTSDITMAQLMGQLKCMTDLR